MSPNAIVSIFRSQHRHIGVVHLSAGVQLPERAKFCFSGAKAADFLLLSGTFDGVPIGDSGPSKLELRKTQLKDYIQRRAQL